MRHHSVVAGSALTRAIRSRSSWRGHPRSDASSVGRKVSQYADIGRVPVGENAEIDNSRPDFVTEFVCPENPMATPPFLTQHPGAQSLRRLLRSHYLAD